MFHKKTPGLIYILEFGYSKTNLDSNLFYFYFKLLSKYLNNTRKERPVTMETG